MTDIAERLARAVLDRIETDRLLNRDNVADAIRKELAVKVVRFPNETGSLTAYKPVVPPALYEHMRDIPGIEDKVIEQKPIPTRTDVPSIVPSSYDVAPFGVLARSEPEMALCKGGPLDGQTIEVKGLKHLCPGHAGAYYANLYLTRDGTIRTQYDWDNQKTHHRDGAKLLADLLPDGDPARTDPTRFTAIGGPYSGSHCTYEELTRDAFLGGRYEIDIHLKHAQWIAKPSNERRRPMFAVGTTIEMKIGCPIPKGWREGAGSLSHHATPAPGNIFITKVE